MPGPLFLSMHAATKYRPPVTAQRVTRSGSTLMLNGQPFRFAAANVYWLGIDDNSPHAFQYPSEAMILQGLEAAVTLGCKVVRSTSLGVSLPGYQDAQAGVGLVTSFPGTAFTYNTAAFATIDYAIQQAGNLGLKLVIPLVDQWRYYNGGRWCFVHNRAGQTSQFYAPTLPQTVASTGTIIDTLYNTEANPPNATYESSPGVYPEQTAEDQFHSSALIRSDFFAYIAEILNHVNQYTGVTIGNDPTIMAFETGNEVYHATVEWTESTAIYIKSIAPNVLVSDGSAADGLATGPSSATSGQAYGPGVSCPHIDIVGAHYYPSVGQTLVSARGAQLTADAAAAISAGKVFCAMEYPWANTTSASDLQSWLNQIEANSNISGVGFWSIIANGDTHGYSPPTYDAPLYIPPTDGTGGQMTTSVSYLQTFATQMVATPTAPSAFTASTPGYAQKSVPYSYQLQANGYPAPTFSVTSGSLPAGVTLSSSGLLSGTPTTTGTSTFTVTATNASGSYAAAGLTLQVYLPVNLLPTAVASTTNAALWTAGGGGSPTLTVSTSYSSQFSADVLYITFGAGGAYPYIYPTSPTASGAAVSASTQYTAWVEGMIGPGNTGILGGSCQVSWYNSGGTYISSVAGSTNTTFNSSSPSVCSVTATSPSTAAYAIAQFNAGQQNVASDILILGQFGIFAYPPVPAVWVA